MPYIVPTADGRSRKMSDVLSVRLPYVVRPRGLLTARGFAFYTLRVAPYIRTGRQPQTEPYLDKLRFLKLVHSIVFRINNY